MMGESDRPGDDSRRQLGTVLAALAPVDPRESADLARVHAWLDSGAPLYRTRPPDVPPMHLVSYFVPVDARGRLLLVDHRKAGLWLPPGGHVEPNEDPWQTVVREAEEELGLAAVPLSGAGPAPVFLSVTRTRGPGSHVDVSLWHVVAAEADQVTTFDEGEFTAVRWWAPAEVSAAPIATLDPELHRFVGKFGAATGWSADGGPAR